MKTYLFDIETIITLLLIILIVSCILYILKIIVHNRVERNYNYNNEVLNDIEMNMNNRYLIRNGILYELEENNEDIIGNQDYNNYGEAGECNN